MKKLPKKPKARKMPKKPKHSAAPSAWVRYDQKVKATEHANAAALSAWKAKCAKIHADQKHKEALIRKYSR